MHTFIVWLSLSFSCFGPIWKSESCGWWCWWTVVIVYGWCWSITLSFPLFSHMFHYSSECITLVWCPSAVFEKWGRFLLPMGAYSSRDRPKWGCQSFSLERHLLSRWLRLLMLPSAVTVFHLHNLLCKYLSGILEAPSLDFSLRIVVSIVWLCVCSTEETNLWLVVPRFMLFWTTCKIACRDG